MLAALLDRLRDRPSRTGSLVITLYGDAIAPRGGELALATLAEVFRAMGIGDGVVRTAVSRLTADGWLVRRRDGRTSAYRLGPRGEQETDAATPVIYGPLERAWDGTVHLAVADPGTERQVLLESGYGAVVPGFLVAPDAAASASLPLRARADAPVLRELAARAWPIRALAERYEGFLNLFDAEIAAVTPLEALVVRTLLVHEWRRVVLRDPRLPSAWLPEDWPGHRARARAAALYGALRPASESWLDGAGLPNAAQDGLRHFSRYGKS